MADDTLRDEIAALKLRIAGAESQRDGWCAAGQHEKYLEACSLVDALELPAHWRARLKRFGGRSPR